MEDKEKKIARELIRIRDEGFPSPLTSLIGTKRVHWLRYLVVGFAAWALWDSWSDTALRSVLLGALGVFFGAILKEIVMINKSGENWTFMKTIIDWGKVSAIAQVNSEQVGDGQSTIRYESDSEGGDKPQPEAEGRSR